MTTFQKITTHLWFANQAEDAARFYVSLFPDSRIDSVTALPAETPSGPPGSVKVIDFTLAGQQFTALNAGPLDPFNHAISLVVHCDDQAEIDRLWRELSDGGKVEQCGWLKDRYGLCWQVVPIALGAMLKDPDRERAGRVAEVMLQMIKLDIDALREAYGGD